MTRSFFNFERFKSQFEFLYGLSSVADPECLSRIPVTNFFIPDPRSASKTKKFFLSSWKYDPGCSSRIRILIFYASRIPYPGVKKAPDPGSGSATLVLSLCTTGTSYSYFCARRWKNIRTGTLLARP